MTVADAIQLAQNAIAASPGSSEAWHLLAYAHEREKDLESALLAASKAVELSPAEPALWFHRGWLHLKVDAAEDCLRDMEAIGERMQPMVEYISNEMERLVLTSDQLAQKRGEDYGEDYFKSGEKPSVSISLIRCE